MSNVIAMTPRRPGVLPIHAAETLTFSGDLRDMLRTITYAHPAFCAVFGQCDDGDQFATLLDADGDAVLGVFPLARGIVRMTDGCGGAVGDFVGLEAVRGVLLSRMGAHNA